MTADFSSGVGYKAWETALKTLDKEMTFDNLKNMSVKGKGHIEIGSSRIGPQDTRLSIRFTGAKGFDSLLEALNQAATAPTDDVKNKAFEQFLHQIEEGNVILETREGEKR